MGFSLFGSSGSKTTSSLATTQDMRTAVAGSVGTLISPGAAVSTPGGGAVQAAPGAVVTQSISTTGLLAEDVDALIGQLTADRASERASVSQLGQSLASGIQSQAAQLGQIVAATKSPDANAITQVLPLALLLGLLWLVKG